MSIDILLSALLLAGAGFEAGASAPAAQGQPVQSATKLYVLTYSQGKAWIPERAMQEQKLAGHARYMRSLAESGVLVAAGPFIQQNGGMAIVRAEDQAGADAILNKDPGVTNGTLVGKAAEWLPVFGSAETLKQ